MPTPSHLPLRLEAVASLVPQGAEGVADLGYDHGMLLVELRRRLPQARLIGVELQAVCATRFVARYGDATRIELRTGDALTALSPGEVEVAVMAGVGERTLIEALERAPEVAASLRRVVFCPADFKGLARPTLARLGWRIADERVAFEAGRFYEIFAAEPGEESGDELSRIYAPRLFERRDPALLPWLLDLRERFSAAIDAAAKGHPARTPGARVLRDKLLRLDEAIERVRGFESPSPG